MPARLFHCTVHNRGTGNIHWMDDHLDHGVWEDPPSSTVHTIAPGQSGEFQAESGGDIPIIGNIATGTEGWLILSTYGSDSIGNAAQMYIRIFWNVPYWHVTPAEATAAATRYDPRSSPGAGEFDTRDRRPANITIRTSKNGRDDSATIQDVPWLAVEMWPGFGGQVVWDGHAYLDVYVDGNVPPDEPVRLPPFSTEKAAKVTPVPLHFSTPSLWGGEWEGDDVEASVIPSSDGLFNVVIREKDTRGNVKVSETEHIGITRAGLFSNSTTATVESRGVQTVGGVQAVSGYRLEVHTNVGTVHEVRQVISAQDKRFSLAAESASAGLASLSATAHPISGDYLSLKNDATLEICKLVSRGATVGYGLRYHRPSFIPSVLNRSTFDEILYVKTSLR
jgi:hypothetical protein